VPPQCEFALEEIALIDRIESLLVQAHEHGDSAVDFDAWRVHGAPDAPLRARFAGATRAARERRPQHTARLDELVTIYAQHETVDPLVAIEGDHVLSSGDTDLLLIDGRHRTSAAADAGVQHRPVFVLGTADADFSLQGERRHPGTGPRKTARSWRTEECRYCSLRQRQCSIFPDGIAASRPSCLCGRCNWCGRVALPLLSEAGRSTATAAA